MSLLRQLFPKKTEKGYDRSAAFRFSPEAVTAFAPSVVNVVAPPAAVEEAAYEMPTSRRHRLVQQQNEFIQYKLALHNIDLANYIGDFFKQAANPFGGKISTPMGPLYASLSDGTFVPNTELGERWGDERDADHDKDSLPTPPSWFVNGKPPTPKIIHYGRGVPPKNV